MSFQVCFIVNYSFFFSGVYHIFTLALSFVLWNEGKVFCNDMKLSKTEEKKKWDVSGGENSWFSGIEVLVKLRA